MPNYYPAVQTPIPLRIYTDAGAPYTGATPTLQVRKNRTGAPATATGTLTHAGSGVWDYTPAVGEVSAPCTFLMLIWSGSGIAHGHEAIEFETDYSSVVAGRIDAPISGVMVLHTGTAQAGAASTITLANAAIATDNIYQGELIWIVSGTGAGQVRVISGYVGATRVATVGRPWTAQPDATSVYRILPIQSPVLDNSLRVTVGTNADKTGYELSGTERTTLYNGIWANASRTLTAISDSAGVTTLLSRLTSTRAAYLDALTALTEGRMVWLERIGTALEETSVGSGLWRLTTLALSRLGIDVSAIKAKTDALPASPAAVGSAMTLANNSVTAAALATDAVAEIAAGISTATSTRILAMPLRSGRTEAVRYTRGAEGPDLLDHILDGTGARIDITGYTITATMIRMGTEAAVFTSVAASLGNAPEEGQVILDWPADSLDTPGQYRLIWTATKAASDTLTWQTLVVVE